MTAPSIMTEADPAYVGYMMRVLTASCMLGINVPLSRQDDFMRVAKAALEKANGQTDSH